MNNELTCSLNYEAEYERMRTMNHDLMTKLRDMEEKYADAKRQVDILNGQMDIVYLIFGGRNRG